MGFTVTVGPDEAGSRLDRLVSATWPTWSRTRWQAAIASGHVRVNGRPVRRTGHALGAGDVVEAAPPAEPPSVAPLEHEPLDVPIPIRYRDDVLVVVCKPAGVVVHPGAGHAHGTLVQALWPDVSPAGGDPGRAGVVHRLDRDTAGLMMLARTQAARAALSDALARRTVHRRYWALVDGQLDPPAGRIDVPIGRDPRHRMRMAVTAGGRPAATRYETVARWPRHSWVALELESGRTHQVRVHLARMGHPVVGDPIYGRGPALGQTHQALFAYALSFEHPTRPGRHLTLVEPWPVPWEDALAQLGWPEQGEVPRRHTWTAISSD